MRAGHRFVLKVILVSSVAYLVAGALAYHLLTKRFYVGDAAIFARFLRSEADPTEWRHVMTWQFPMLLARGLLISLALLPFRPALMSFALPKRVTRPLRALLRAPPPRGRSAEPKQPRGHRLHATGAHRRRAVPAHPTRNVAPESALRVGHRALGLREARRASAHLTLTAAPDDAVATAVHAASKRSRFITLFHTATKSSTNVSCASELA